MDYYPVILFCYKRLDHLKETVEHLSKNFLAGSTDLYIYSDAAGKPSDEQDILDVRAYLKTISGFKTVSVIKAEKNKGLARSIIEGVTDVLKVHEAAIVLEDDLITSTNFLSYMNDSLRFYRDNHKVFSISGYSFPINLPSQYHFDNYFTQRASSWGWATWRDRWEHVDWTVSDYHEFSKSTRIQKDFNRMGSDLSGMLIRQMNGKINSWAIRWCYHQFKTKTFTAFPVISKIQNIGFGTAATHTSAVMKSRFATELDGSNKDNFHFNGEVSISPAIIKQFVSRYSILTRLKYKAMGYLFN
ncbi:sugar transferase [Desertivirga xinjiangensis]|uniref:sugar transferase n=1 Tax=Desertivirga xinjiangensis TaxID=539206 RepID=UPI00210A305B|nr:sugar transferase [Pedobacter xinjiangensis]